MFLRTLYTVHRNAGRGLAAGLTLFVIFGCNGANQMSDADRYRAEYCPPVDAAHSFLERPYYGGSGNMSSFQAVRAAMNVVCARCHQQPAKTGDFFYFDSFMGQDVPIDDKIQYIGGFSELAQKMYDAMTNPDLKKRMPPESERGGDPDAFMPTAKKLKEWMDAGMPTGTFEVGKVTTIPTGKYRPVVPNKTSDLGDCVPSAKAVGFDYKIDRFFETATALPKYLSDTDLSSLDPLYNAQHGTFAYNVEYPLWADNAEKGRWIHIPMKMVGDHLEKQQVTFDAVNGGFNIPENTRFYKTFYRAVALPNKTTKYRRIETRVIVARQPWEKSLFGTYQWDDEEQVATLVDAPYRDGTPWKDIEFDVVIDEKTQAIRPYAIPGKDRCVDCHRGSPMNNFVLGFTPLEINKRALGEGGRLDLALESDLTQVERFISYGVLGGIKSAAELPVLEKAGSSPPRNDFELRANGYTVGNCYHCHNPMGLAITSSDPQVQLMLGPGALFNYSTANRSVEIPTRHLLPTDGDETGSQIYHKIADAPDSFGLYSQMPMHTPGTPDCRALTVIGKWIHSVGAGDADSWVPACKKTNPFIFVDFDFHQIKTDKYTPRRADWDGPGGMPPFYRNLTLSPSLKQAIQTKYAVGFWTDNANCNFPTLPDPGDKRPPWTQDGDPWGQIYYTTPGSYFFQSTCMKCHGGGADGNSSLAKGILLASGGSVRVADLINGLFGNKGANLSTFDVKGGPNLAPNYLIWMAMEGTRVKFPPEVSSIVGKHGARMLNIVRDGCINQVNGASTKYQEDYEIFNKICFMENLTPDDPSLQYDNLGNPVNPAAVEAWADRGAINAGWAIFDFLSNASQGNWEPRVNQCELAGFGKK